MATNESETLAGIHVGQAEGDGPPDAGVFEESREIRGQGGASRQTGRMP